MGAIEKILLLDNNNEKKNGEIRRIFRLATQ